MATVIERPADRVVERREIVERTDSGAGWAIALMVLVALLVAGFVWARYYRAPAAAPATTGTSVNVSLPAVPNTGTTPNADSGPGNATGPH
ncbi:MAG TPA: hypothetical protein VIY48_10285, partial [Candidatus Paceibacterota bacterium]